MRVFHYIKSWAPLALVMATQWIASFVHAADGNNPFSADKTGLKTTAEKAGVGGFTPDLPAVIGSAINIAFGLVGSIFLILMIYAGVLWMTAAGNSDTVDKAKGIIKTAIIGIIVTFGSYAITSYVFSLIGQVAGGS